jgi:hypothetical protein
MSVVDLTAIFDHPYFDVMMEEVMYEEGNEEIAKLFEEKVDEKYKSIYDNTDYMTMNNNQIYNRDDDFGSLFSSKTSLYK